MQNITALIRHFLTFGGGYFVANGYLDEASSHEIIGGLTALFGVIWSIGHKNPETVQKVMKKTPFSLLILPLFLAFSTLPQGCVTNPDGTRSLDPSAKILLSSVARAATLIGLSAAAVELPIIAPYVPSMSREINELFATKSDPEDLGQGVQDILKRYAIALGSDELDKIVGEFIEKELLPETPAADPTGGEQFRFNSTIAGALE
tara:strand:+ start:2612 stop:3226 length:615 start_codon:yes stop_codon:yes gene_type:complete